MMQVTYELAVGVDAPVSPPEEFWLRMTKTGDDQDMLDMYDRLVELRDGGSLVRNIELTELRTDPDAPTGPPEQIPHPRGGQPSGDDVRTS